MSSVIDIIKKAMDERKSISAIYDDHNRKLSPYILGRKRNELQCLFYQYGGTSKSGVINGHSEKNWRCIKLSQLMQVRILDEPLQKPNIISHKKPSTCVDHIIKKIDIT